ncbi:MAG TPA: MTH938/NDUFAF3 family protein [Steroidobacteraceae bacterium]|nr:MTH938/NDUFAF3 family protein [Steroidobacteraceae bacterium]
MKLTRDSRADVNLIRGYAPGAVRVGERLVSAHCIVAADALITDWDAPSAASLAAPHLERIFALNPEVVLLGTGPKQTFPSAEVRAAFAARGIALETMDLGAACRTYNILVQEERRVVAMLFVS